MRKAICGGLVLLFVVALAAAGNSGPAAAASAATVFVEAGGGRDVAPPRAMYPSTNPFSFQVPGGGASLLRWGGARGVALRLVGPCGRCP